MKKLIIIHGGFFFGLVLGALVLIGEIKCIIKAINCNWEPVGKAEIIYTGSAVTGLGCITGWFDIEDK
jgi:hypothetical protein